MVAGISFRRMFHRKGWRTLVLPELMVVLLLAGGGKAVAAAGSMNGPDETVMDSTALMMLELRADHAEAREQCYLYTELLHRLIELEGRQMSAGATDDATATLRQIEAVTVKLRASSVPEAKRLKGAEQLMEHTEKRFADMAHVASGDERAAMQATLQHLNTLHDRLLSLVFAH